MATRSQLAEALTGQDITTAYGRNIATAALVKRISELVHTEGRLELRGFGVFTQKTKPSRIARNPRTGEKVLTEEYTTIRFKSSKKLRK